MKTIDEIMDEEFSDGMFQTLEDFELGYIKDAMKIYARQEAIAFSKWNCEGLWSTSRDMWYPYGDEDNPITGEQLYKLFKSK